MLNKKEIFTSELLEQIPNRFVLSLAIAKRARQLQEGAKPLVVLENEEDTKQPILVALKELKAGKFEINLHEEKDEELEYIEEIDRYFEDTIATEKPEEDQKSKKEPKTKSKFKSLAA
ncbi:MAG: DNA-directed RNA polymerase subunit omega [Candidatus Margulisiibacteriota bacterium]|jgi:DNA-directed RNA polymerase omega subunit